MRLANRYDDFESTMEGLSSGFQVWHIATRNPVLCCEDDFDEFLDQPELQQYDQFPITSSRGYVVGVLERNVAGPQAWTRRPLDASVLTAASQPLQSFIPTLADLPYRLVVGGSEINAIVTKSDVQKLPVQIHVFAMLTHLESLMIQRIAEHVESDDEWLCYLTRKQRDQIKHYCATAKNDRLDPPLIEFTSMGHKIQILQAVCPMCAEESTELWKIKDLRDSIAHGKPYAETKENLRLFIGRLDLVGEWIVRLRDGACLGVPSV